VAIRLRTEIPGPKTRELLERRARAVPQGVSAATPLFVRRASGALLEDVDGNVFVDFAGGIAVANAGHCPPAVVEAVREQAGRVLHTCFMLVGYEGYVELAEALAAAAPGTSAKKAMFVNSGAEAVENGVKIARKHTGRRAVACFENAFHGRTLLAMTLTGNAKPYKDGFAPFAPEVYRFPYAYCYRCPHGQSHPGCGLHCLKALESSLDAEIGCHNVAAVVVEPVQGEGGFLVPPPGYLRGLKDICERHGIMLVVDEVQTGFGRTGRLFAIEHEGIEPDILLTAKGIAAGLPLAGVVGRAEVMDAVHKGGIGGTYGGNPVACAAALQVLRMINRPEFLERVRRIGSRLAAFCRELQDACPLVGDVRAQGAMVAMELVRDRETKEPATEAVAAVVKYAYEHGLILVKAGRCGNVLRFLPPLVIGDEELDEGLAVLAEALEAVG